MTSRTCSEREHRIGNWNENNSHLCSSLLVYVLAAGVTISRSLQISEVPLPASSGVERGLVGGWDASSSHYKGVTQVYAAALPVKLLVRPRQKCLMIYQREYFMLKLVEDSDPSAFTVSVVFAEKDPPSK